jgi:hypothetical protein
LGHWFAWYMVMSFLEEYSGYNCIGHQMVQEACPNQILRALSSNRWRQFIVSAVRGVRIYWLWRTYQWAVTTQVWPAFFPTPPPKSYLKRQNISSVSASQRFAVVSCRVQIVFLICCSLHFCSVTMMFASSFGRMWGWFQAMWCAISADHKCLRMSTLVLKTVAGDVGA